MADLFTNLGHVISFWQRERTRRFRNHKWSVAKHTNTI